MEDGPNFCGLIRIFELYTSFLFQTQVALKSHLDIHEGIKNFVCSECGFAFRSKQEMKGKVVNLGSDTFGNLIFQKGLQN